MYWHNEAAGESDVCQDHHELIRKRFAHLTTDRPHAKPDQRFADTPKPEDGEIFESVSFEEML